MKTLLLAALGCGALAQPVISFDARAGVVIVRGAPLDPGALRVYLGDAATAMLGDVDVVEGGLRFTPRFRFLAGREHRAVLSVTGGEPVVYRFRTEAVARGASTRVAAIYPSADVVPANLLRFYIHFSRPMSRRGIERHIRLLDESGREVEAPFLAMEEGLWDPEGRRLTLFLDPGRIKRGVGLRETMGPPLRPGGRYRLVVSRAAEDAEGSPLVADSVKEFGVTEEDRTSPDVERWVIDPPVIGTRSALVITAEKALDAALFARMVRVVDGGGREVAGRVSVEAGETRWRFVPELAWRTGDYSLRVGAELEDLAGNRPGRLFDEEARADGRRVESREVVRRINGAR